MKQFLIIFCFILTACITCQAKYVQSCVVKYKTQQGWSKKYTVNVTFMTGSELNSATTSFKYSSFTVYAIIFWDRDQATVIKLKSFLTCGTEVDKSCITNAIGDLKGYDQDDDEWNICTSDYCL